MLGGWLFVFKLSLKQIGVVKNAKKIIFTDATINQNTLNLLSSRTSNNKTIFKKRKITDKKRIFKKCTEQGKGRAYA